MRVLLIHLRVVAVLLLASGTAAAQQVIDFTSVVRRAQPAVVTLHTFDAAGHRLGLASGFVVDGGRVVTNAHVIEGAARVEIFDAEEHLLGTVDHAEAIDAEADLAVLPAIRGARGLALAAAEPAVGEAVLAIGSPKGLTHTVSDGLVSAVRDLEGRRWIQISAPISEGSSGGPVLNRNGEVIGVSVAVLSEGQNLNFAIPAQEVRAILTSPRARVAFPGGARSERHTGHAGAHAAPVPSLEIGETVDGALERSDPRLENGVYVDSYRMAGRAGDVVTITLRSADFDAFVVVGDVAGGTPLGYDDDSAGDFDAQVTVVLPRDGTYAIGVVAASHPPTGRYTLSVQPGPAMAARP